MADRLEVSRDIAASPEAVYAAISDVTRMGEWSEECHSCTWHDGFDGAVVGAVFDGHNRNGDHEWTTQGTVVEADPGRSFVFECSMFDFHFATWGYRIEPTATGSRITEWTLDLRPESVMEFSATTSGVADRGARNRHTMSTTLDRLAAALESGSPTRWGLDATKPIRIPVDRYIAPEWMARENEQMWPRVWQFACSVDHVAEPGDFYEYRAGWVSILVVRGEDGELRAFQNTCLHRGNTICEGTGSGLAELRCPYHRWAWHTDGRLREVPSRRWFGTMDNDEYALIAARVETWGPTVWVNLDRQAMPLSEWLEGIPADTDWAAFDDFRCNSLIVRDVPANWKVVSEGFSETYHVQGVHPEMLGYINDVEARQHLWHRHGVSYQDYGVPSPRLGRDVDETLVWDTWVQSMGTRLGIPSGTTEPAPPVPDGSTMQAVIAERIVAHQRSLGVDISAFPLKRITGCAQYNFFPNATLLLWSDMVNVLSTRPGRTPDECQFVMTNFHRAPSGAPRSKPITIGPEAGELPLGLVIGQDINIMHTAQLGLHQPGLRELSVSAEEARVVNLHKNLEEWCGRA